MKALGYTEKISALIELSKLDGFELGRVIIEHRERYTVQTEKGISSAEITGNLRFTAESRRDFPAVGDWVKLAMMDSEHSIILEVLPRFSTLERKAVGKESEIQIIASNIDTAFIVQAVGYDFNLKRIERYLAICRTSDIEPVIILTKIDLIDSKKIEELCDKISSRLEQLKVIPLSSISGLGFNELENHFEKYKTYCFLGSSGVGKSTIVNKLKGEEILKTTSISDSNSKGKHTTSHRELIILPNESIVIDTPGMRELGMSESAKGIERTYDQIEVLSSECMFNDCTHTNEKGCAVLKALESNELSIDVFENYKKLKREQEHFSSSVSERRKKGKAQAKLYRSVLEQRKKDKF